MPPERPAGQINYLGNEGIEDGPCRQAPSHVTHPHHSRENGLSVPGREILVFMRFSLLTEGGHWRIANQDQEAYKKELFSEERLRFRLWALEHLSLRSVIRSSQKLAGSGINVTFVLMTSNEMPDWAIDELTRILRAFPHSHLKLYGVASGYPKDLVEQETKSILTDRGGEVIFATTALDDDDILGDNFLVSLSRYVDKAYVGHCVTLANGLVGHLDVDKLEFARFCQLFLPMTSVGISYVNCHDPSDGFAEATYVTVTGLGGHLRVDNKVPLIVDARSPNWVRTMHGNNDTKVGRRRHWSLDLPAASEAYARQCIDLDAYPIEAAGREELRATPPVVKGHSSWTRAAVRDARQKKALLRVRKKLAQQTA